MPLERTPHHCYSTSSLGRRTSSNRSRLQHGASKLYCDPHGLSSLDSGSMYSPMSSSSLSLYLPPRTPVSTSSSFRSLRSQLPHYSANDGVPPMSPAMSRRDNIIHNLVSTSNDARNHYFRSRDSFSVITGSDPLQSPSTSRRLPHSSVKSSRVSSRSHTTDLDVASSIARSTGAYHALQNHGTTFQNLYHPTVIERPSFASYRPLPKKEKVPVQLARRDRPLIKFLEREDFNPAKVRTLLNAWAKDENIDDDTVDEERSDRKRDSVRSNDSGIGSYRGSRRSRQKSGDAFCDNSADDSTGTGNHVDRRDQRISIGSPTDIRASLVDEGVHLETDDGLHTSPDETSLADHNIDAISTSNAKESQVLSLDKYNNALKENIKQPDCEMYSSSDNQQGKRRVRINTEKYVVSFNVKDKSADENNNTESIQNFNNGLYENGTRLRRENTAAKNNSNSVEKSNTSKKKCDNILEDQITNDLATDNILTTSKPENITQVTLRRIEETEAMKPLDEKRENNREKISEKVHKSAYGQVSTKTNLELEGKSFCKSKMNQPCKEIRKECLVDSQKQTAEMNIKNRLDKKHLEISETSKIKCTVAITKKEVTCEEKSVVQPVLDQLPTKASEIKNETGKVKKFETELKHKTEDEKYLPLIAEYEGKSNFSKQQKNQKATLNSTTSCSKSNDNKLSENYIRTEVKNEVANCGKNIEQENISRLPTNATATPLTTEGNLEKVKYADASRSKIKPLLHEKMKEHVALESKGKSLESAKILNSVEVTTKTKVQEPQKSNLKHLVPSKDGALKTENFSVVREMDSNKNAVVQQISKSDHSETNKNNKCGNFDEKHLCANIQQVKIIPESETVGISKTQVLRTKTFKEIPKENTVPELNAPTKALTKIGKNAVNEPSGKSRGGLDEKERDENLKFGALQKEPEKLNHNSCILNLNAEKTKLNTERSKIDSQPCTEFETPKNISISLQNNFSEKPQLNTERPKTESKPCTEPEASKNISILLQKNLSEKPQLNTERPKGESKPCTEFVTPKYISNSLQKNLSEKSQLNTERLTTESKPCTEPETPKNTSISLQKELSEKIQLNTERPKAESKPYTEPGTPKNISNSLQKDLSEKFPVGNEKNAGKVASAFDLSPSVNTLHGLQKNKSEDLSKSMATDVKKSFSAEFKTSLKETSNENSNEMSKTRKLMTMGTPGFSTEVHCTGENQTAPKNTVIEAPDVADKRFEEKNSEKVAKGVNKIKRATTATLPVVSSSEVQNKLQKSSTTDNVDKKLDCNKVEKKVKPPLPVSPAKKVVKSNRREHIETKKPTCPTGSEENKISSENLISSTDQNTPEGSTENSSLSVTTPISNGISKHTAGKVQQILNGEIISESMNMGTVSVTELHSENGDVKISPKPEIPANNVTCSKKEPDKNSNSSDAKLNEDEKRIPRKYVPQRLKTGSQTLEKEKVVEKERKSHDQVPPPCDVVLPNSGATVLDSSNNIKFQADNVKPDLCDIKTVSETNISTGLIPVTSKRNVNKDVTQLETFKEGKDCKESIKKPSESSRSLILENKQNDTLVKKKEEDFFKATTVSLKTEQVGVLRKLKTKTLEADSIENKADKNMTKKESAVVDVHVFNSDNVESKALMTSDPKKAKEICKKETADRAQESEIEKVHVNQLLISEHSKEPKTANDEKRMPGDFHSGTTTDSQKVKYSLESEMNSNSQSLPAGRKGKQSPNQSVQPKDITEAEAIPMKEKLQAGLVKKEKDPDNDKPILLGGKVKLGEIPKNTDDVSVITEDNDEKEKRDIFAKTEACHKAQPIEANNNKNGTAEEKQKCSVGENTKPKKEVVSGNAEEKPKKKKKKKVPKVDTGPKSEIIGLPVETPTVTNKPLECETKTEEKQTNGDVSLDTNTTSHRIQDALLLDPERIPRKSLDVLWGDYEGFATEYDEPVQAEEDKYKKSYSLRNFNLMKVLGRGSYGKVMLAELKGHKQYYAVKCIKKYALLKGDDVDCTTIEKEVLVIGLDHPYLCSLYCTFQNETHLFFVMEYLSGGDLMFQLEQSGVFDERRAKFYAAEIVCALKYLHRHGIIYRDAKLDNICIDADGHIRLVDFGFCKLRIPRKEALPRNLCGTPDYMAPEVLRGYPYNQAVDWWSFGVMLFEMLTGRSPFVGDNEVQILNSILRYDLCFLPFVTDPSTIEFVTLLLNIDSEKRLGMPACPKGDIRWQPFFLLTDWYKVERKELQPPFKPRVNSKTDVGNFDKDFTRERAALTPTDKRIVASLDHSQFKGFSYTNPQFVDML